MKASLSNRIGIASMKGIGATITELFWRAHKARMLPGDEHVQVIRSVHYGRHPNQAYDLYLPQGADPDTPLPTLVFIHGGGWVMCDRKMSSAVGRTLAARGMAVVAPGYRLLPEVSQTVQRRDLQAAMEHVSRYAASRFGLNLDRMMVAGESAGAHLTLRLAQAWPSSVARPLGVVGIYGLYDVRHLSRHGRDRVYGPMLAALRQGAAFYDMAADHSALRPLPWSDVPVLLLHGEADTLAPCGQSHLLAEYLAQGGVDVTVRTYPRAAHGFIYDGSPNNRAARHGYRALWRFMHQGGMFDEASYPVRMSSLRPPARAA